MKGVRRRFDWKVRGSSSPFNKKSEMTELHVSDQYVDRRNTAVNNKEQLV